MAGAVASGRDVLLAPIAAALAVVRWFAARPAMVAAVSVLMVCVPLGGRDVAAAAHVTPGDLAATALVVIVAARALGRARLPRSGLWWAVAATTVGFALATYVSHDPGDSAYGFVRYMELFVVVPLAVVFAIRGPRDAELVCAAVIAAALIESLVGVAQYLSGAGASYEGRNVRAIGTFSALDVQAMATVVGYGLVVAVGLALTRGGRLRAVLLAIAGFLLVALLLSLSRGGLIATVVALLVMVLVVRPRLLVPVVAYGGAAVLVLAGAFGVDATGVGARLGSIGASTSAPDQSVTDRYVLWKTAGAIWRDHPITGVGLKQFPDYRDSYAPVNLSSGSDVADPGLAFQREPLLSPHNMYLLVLSEQGLVGALCLGGLLFGVAIMTIRRARQWRAAWPEPAGGTGGVSVAAVGVVVWTLVNFLYGDIGGQTTVLMSVTLGLALWQAVQPPPGSKRSIAGTR